MRHLLLMCSVLFTTVSFAYADTCSSTSNGYPFYLAAISADKTEVLCFYSPNPPLIYDIQFLTGTNFQPISEWNWQMHQNFFIVSDGTVCQDNDPSYCAFQDQGQ